MLEDTRRLSLLLGTLSLFDLSSSLDVAVFEYEVVHEELEVVDVRDGVSRSGIVARTSESSGVSGVAGLEVLFVSGEWRVSWVSGIG